MDPFTTAAGDLVATHGPWILFVMAVAETCFLTGLVVPSGVATSVATALALEGQISLVSVMVAAVSGGALGDTVGFWVGRASGERLSEGRGWAGRRYRRLHPAAVRFLGRHPLYSVTVARLVSFVRTLMPMAVGMSPMRYPLFLAFDLPGVLAWAAMYACIGLLASESWMAVTSVVGAGWTVGFLVTGVALWTRMRRRGRRRPRPSREG